MTERKYWQFDGAETLRRIDAALRERHHIDISQRGQIKQAAGVLGIKPSTIPMWIKREKAPLRNLGQYADRLDVQLTYLLGIDDEMGEPTRSTNDRHVAAVDDSLEERIIAKIDAKFVEFDVRLSKLEKTG